VANRSDFFRAKVPRHIKKMLALNHCDPHERAVMRKLFQDAHANHVAFRLKVRSGKAGAQDDGGEE